MQVAEIDPTKPKAPKPGEGWVPTADGQGWLPPDQAGSAAAAPAGPTKIAPITPSPMTATGGVATHQPAPVEAQAEGPPLQADPATPAVTTPAKPTTVNDAFKTALMDSLTKPIGIDANDPIIKGQTDAFSLAQTRAKQRDREAMAGRAAASGQLSDLAGSGAFDEGLSNLEQRQGEAEAGFNAGLAGDELNKQRDNLYRYAALAGSTLSAEEGRALQEKLANLDAQIRREGMAQQGGQFQQDLDLRTLLGKGQLEQGQGDLDLRTLLGQGQLDLGGQDLRLRQLLGEGGLNLNLLQLLTGNQQFGQNLGAQLGMFGANQDADLWKAILGGIG